MEKLLNEIITETTLALKESIRCENSFIQKKLLSTLGNIKFLEKELEKKLKLNKIKKLSRQELEENEIKKVKRRIPRWKKNPTQMNYKILKAFIELSNNGKYSVNLISLERYLNLKDSKKFLGHYNQLKTISAKNHGKVFSEIDGQIFLWKPVEKFIRDSFRI